MFSGSSCGLVFPDPQKILTSTLRNTRIENSNIYLQIIQIFKIIIHCIYGVQVYRLCCENSTHLLDTLLVSDSYIRECEVEFHPKQLNI